MLAALGRGPGRVVVLDALAIGAPVDSVVMNNRQGMALATRKLIALGHTHIGYCYGKTRISNFTRTRKRVSRRTAQGGPERCRCGPRRGEFRDQHGPARALRLARQAHRAAADRARLRKRLHGHRRPEGAGQHRGSRCPGDVSVTGFDDIAESAVTTPDLTTVNVSTREIAHAAIARLLDTPRASPIPCRSSRSSTRAWSSAVRRRRRRCADAWRAGGGHLFRQSRQRMCKAPRPQVVAETLTDRIPRETTLSRSDNCIPLPAYWIHSSRRKQRASQRQRGRSWRLAPSFALHAEPHSNPEPPSARPAVHRSKPRRRHHRPGRAHRHHRRGVPHRRHHARAPRQPPAPRHTCSSSGAKKAGRATASAAATNRLRPPKPHHSPRRNRSHAPHRRRKAGQVSVRAGSRPFIAASHSCL